MDKNKTNKLEEIGYMITISCGICIYFEGNKFTGWGVCKKYKYKHLKHSDEDRNLSVSIYGTCNKATIDSKACNFHGFEPFIKQIKG